MKKTIFLLMVFLAATAALSAQTVLIAKEDTAYKKALVEDLVPALEAEGILVVVIDHKNDNLMAVNPTEYEAVYVLNSGAQKMVRPWVVEWLDSIEAVDDNVLLHTTKINRWTEPVEVDAISSASQKSNIDEMIVQIVDWVRAKI